jgi:exodeoxyribonuclease V beta subunit
MQAEPSVFDSARVQLTPGINLIEASAGTGKTHAIAMLALRSVAELGIPIDKLLIVTFTKAATEELKAKVRIRLAQARDLLQGRFPESERDETLRTWAGSIQDRDLVLARLQLALHDIDRASIFTIHAFCQRMLQEQALECGQLFDVELLTDIKHIRDQVVDDYWRIHVYPLPPLPCSILTASFPAPADLFASVSGIPAAADRIEPVAADPAEALDVLDTACTRMIAWWRRCSIELRPLLLRGVAEQKFKKEFTQNFVGWWQGLDEFFRGAIDALPAGLSFLSRAELKGELNGQKLRGEDKKRAFLDSLVLPDNEISDLLAAVQGLLLSFRAGLAQVLKTEVERRLFQRGAMSFDDLIQCLSRALQDVQGLALQRILQERYTVALIDEFQDTDEAQWHIFQTLFGGGGHYLYLIGDPKQAIYKFRGADIFSYFKAKGCADIYLTLDRNHRSHPHLVHEINRLFMSRPQPFGFPENVMGYHRVVPARSVEDGMLHKDGKALPALVYNQLPESDETSGRWSSTKASEKILQFTVMEVLRLLDVTNPVLLLENEKSRSVRPKDIAVLVRTNNQAEDYRQAFAEASIPAVVVSRRSVFQTDTCRELLCLLEAIAAPGDTQLLKTAMTVRWFGLTGDELQRVWQDEERFDGWHSRFQVYCKIWQAQGFLPMMTRLLVDEQVLVTLAEGRSAERQIANIHHLLELVQTEESAENAGIDQILQWLQTMIRGGQGVEDVELRLESDEEAVRIVTMHRSKGLEYPIVFCPYLWSRSPRLRYEKSMISFHDQDHRLVLDLGSDQFAERREKALSEELAEELRLLYVAVTRARLRCYVFWADVQKKADSFDSALGYLLFSNGYVDFKAQMRALQPSLDQHSVAHLIIPVEQEEKVQYTGWGQEVTELAPLPPTGRSLHSDWQMSSYSAMASLSEYNDPPAPGGPVAETAPIPCPGLPAGAGFGNVVHDILETASFAAIASGADLGEEIAQRCSRYGIQAEVGVLQRLLHNTVTTPLAANTGASFNLADLAEKRYSKEMPFFFHPDRISTREINTILAAEPTVTPLSHTMMQGYLTGFVDLFCEYDGKYYLFDYKTNFLGNAVSDYGAENLVRAMAAHNYGLQYWIYTLVLHRHLQNVQPDYDYRRHFGGVLYLFVRGMIPGIPGSGVHYTLPDRDLLERLNICLGSVK